MLREDLVLGAGPGEAALFATALVLLSWMIVELLRNTTKTAQ